MDTLQLYGITRTPRTRCRPVQAAGAPSGAVGHACSAGGVSGCCPGTGLPRGCCCGMGLPRAALPGRDLPVRGRHSLPKGAERDGTARMTPHGKTAGSCQTPLLQGPTRSPWPGCLPPAANPPPFPVPSLHQERSFLLLYQPHRDPRAHCRLPAQRSPLGCEDGRAPRLSGSPPQANTAHGSEGSPDPRAGGDIPPQSLGESRLHWARDPGRRRRTERRQHDRWAIKAISGMPGQALSSPWPPCTIPSFPPIPAGCEGRLVTHRPPTPGPRSPGFQPAWGTRGICPRSRGSRSSIGAAFSFQRSGKLLFVKQR